MIVTLVEVCFLLSAIPVNVQYFTTNTASLRKVSLSVSVLYTNLTHCLHFYVVKTTFHCGVTYQMLIIIINGTFF